MGHHKGTKELPSRTAPVCYREVTVTFERVRRLLLFSLLFWKTRAMTIKMTMQNWSNSLHFSPTAWLVCCFPVYRSRLSAFSRKTIIPMTTIPSSLRQSLILSYTQCFRKSQLSIGLLIPSFCIMSLFLGILRRWVTVCGPQRRSRSIQLQTDMRLILFVFGHGKSPSWM